MTNDFQIVHLGMDWNTPELAYDKKTFIAADVYDSLYRYRLWRACNDDMNRLGMGYRAYRMHIDSTFDALLDGGYQFHNSLGKPLVFTALSPDDLYGFLGRKINAPKGPARELTLRKIQVLDAYFHAYYPTIARAFSSRNEFSALASVGTLFFANPEVDDISEEQLAAISGAYVCNEVSFEAQINSAFPSTPSEDIFRIPVIFIIHPPERSFVMVHKLLLRPKNEYFLHDTRFWKIYVKAKQLVEEHKFELPEDTIAFQGIGFPARRIDDDSDSLHLSSIMRDRVTKAPYITSMDFGAPYIDMSHAIPFSADHLHSDGVDYQRSRSIFRHLKLLEEKRERERTESEETDLLSVEVTENTFAKVFSVNPRARSEEQREEAWQHDKSLLMDKLMFSEEFFKYIDILEYELADGGNS